MRLKIRLSDQVAVTTILDPGVHEDTPMVIVYPDSAVYAPVTWRCAYIVEEHLYKGNIVPSLLAMMHEMVPEIGWMRAAVVHCGPKADCVGARGRC